jgi:hypothetical protein
VAARITSAATAPVLCRVVSTLTPSASW